MMIMEKLSSLVNGLDPFQEPFTQEGRELVKLDLRLGLLGLVAVTVVGDEPLRLS